MLADLNLPYPKMIDVAVPANLVCGIQDPPPKIWAVPTEASSWVVQKIICLLPPVILWENNLVNGWCGPLVVTCKTLLFDDISENDTNDKWSQFVSPLLLQNSNRFWYLSETCSILDGVLKQTTIEAENMMQGVVVMDHMTLVLTS